MTTKIKDFFRNLVLKFKESERWYAKPKLLYSLLVVFIFFLYISFFLFVGSFSNFPEGKLVSLKKGMSVKAMGETLEAEGVVSSGSILTTIIVALGYENKVVSGPYFFEKKEGVIPVFKRLISGDFKTLPLRLTFPEGFTARQITNRLQATLLDFDADAFYKLALPKEGYLYPETYFFFPDATPEDVMESFNQEFNKNIGEFKNEIKSSGKSINDIVILASILEREVRSLEDKKLVAGIIYKRMSVGMALQVDATLAYERGLGSFDLTRADLKKDSPYNTYTNRGLPPSPISNPGKDSIQAALEPEKSPYIYFLTDPEGKVHYAKTYSEHVRNKALYLR